MKQSIGWHKDCLANGRQSLQAMRDELKRTQDYLQQRIASLEADIMVRDAQIIEAELRGVTEFDADKFGIKRAAK